MTRIKRGTVAHKKRERLLKNTKGYMWGRKSKERAAKEALLHAWSHSFNDRKKKKRDFRRLWQVKINASARKEGTNYNKFIYSLGKKNIGLDRKILADLAENEPETFKKIVSYTTEE